MNFLNYISFGVEAFSVAMQLIMQIKSPSTLDPNTVWLEVQPLLISIGSLTKHTVDMQIAQEVTIAAVGILKGKLTGSVVAQ